MQSLNANNMVSILQEKNSPTLVRDEHDERVNVIEREIMDDDGLMVPVTITYDWRWYKGLDWEIWVTGFDYAYPDTANIGPVDLRNEVKRLIEEEEKCKVSFDY